MQPVSDPRSEAPAVETEMLKGIHEFSPETTGALGVTWAVSLERHVQELGWARLGVCSVAPFEEAGRALRQWLAHGYQGQMHYLERERTRPEALLPGAASLVVAALAYPGAREPGQAIASYARGTDYHHVLKVKLLDLAQRIANDLGRPLRARACVDTAPLLERAAAERAGIGFTGKSTLTIVPGVGTYVLLGELLLDVELPTTHKQQSGCGRCTRCMDACPTGAFVGPYVLDARRCISYLTIEHRGSIPTELRSGIGTHVFGCDICQLVCPFNATKRQVSRDPQLAPRAEQPDLVELLQLTSSGYRRLTERTALSRVSRGQLQRNAAVALGNSDHPQALPALVQALSHPDATVRGHVAWALGQKRCDAIAARSALQSALSVEQDETACDEIRAALVRLET